jgi:dienelactone hydrolase
MMYLMVTDIFGQCEASDLLTNRLEGLGHNVTVCDPYQGDYRHFINEGEAYHAFMDSMGHEAFYQMSVSWVTALKPDIIIGFSAGASVAWRLSAQDNLSIKQVICFYPSQIRHYSELEPKYACRLILPNHESHFDVTMMANTLSSTANLEIIMSDYGHGFMNPKSAQYDKKAETIGFTYIDNFK